MGKVAVSFKVMPSDETKDLVAIEKGLKEDLSKNYALGKSSIEELAFGIKVLKLIVIMGDEGGLVDSVEQRIRSFQDVGEVEVEEVSLIS
ncbi:MAG: elongation factor 1-beta [Candidatus Thermoplasmatota archaeon]|nr:elongation factor 1-beta [Candidatus Thermoplasmatota archaeon]MCL5930825.1 elongation factor 1-beta [Candidatus Thermoplasmatota archaeon]